MGPWSIGPDHSYGPHGSAPRVEGILLMATPRDILNYWFDSGPGRDRLAIWFGGGKETDDEIKERFGDDVEAALIGQLDDWSKSPRGRLALILLLDQFTRNIYRDSPRKFLGDHAAQRQVIKALAKGEDLLLKPYERAFLYMPLQHAENADLQARGVAAFERLAKDVPRSERPAFETFLEHARDHAAIVERFGRFPDRNKIRGRTSTPDEERFLAKEPRPWFEAQ